MSIVEASLAGSLIETPDKDDGEDDGEGNYQSWRALFLVPILFLAGAGISGPKITYQGIGKRLFGDEINLFYNFSDGANGAITVIVAPLFGALSDRWGRKPLIVLSCAMVLGPRVLLWFFNTPESGPSASGFLTFLIVDALSALFGAGPASLFTLLQAGINDTCPPSQRATMMGILFGFGMGVGLIFPPLIFAWVESTWGDTAVIIFDVGVCTFNVLFAMAIPLPSRKASVTAPLKCSQLNPFRYFRMLTGGVEGVSSSSVRVLRVLFFSILGLYIAKMGMMMALTLYARDRYDFDTLQATWMSVVYGCCCLVGQLGMPYIIKLWSKKTAIIFGAVCGLLTCSILAIPDVPSWSLYVAEGVLSFSFISYTCAVTYAGELVPASLRGEAVGALNISNALSVTIGPPVFGILVNAFLKTNYPGGAFLVLGALTLAGLLAALLLPKETARPSEVVAPSAGENVDA